ncbi:MAG TPA: flagellar motor protein MotB [Candidatus Fournierella merdavium]|uniref:flagellar motor protein MotB n=1 Tax=Candidatus Allofournierella merdavium TaxID=2838593 RepID=UPI001FA3B8B5|nr:flagellar motor protein MotB [Candidatus Fournierella merdavium]
MKRKSGGSGGANWMDTYGDMVTLLLCFFVMLYSMSTMDKEKWIALVQSFNPSAVTEEVSGGLGSENSDAEALTQAQVDADIEDLYQSMKNYIEQEQLSTQVSITKGGGYVFVSFDNTVFFDGDSYILRDDGKVVLDQVAKSIADVSGSIDEIRVLGHTAQDDPVSPNNPRNDRFLATNRAAVVTVYLQEKNIIDPSRLVSVGYGQWRPVADNATPEGRAQNRRVELLVTGLNMENGIGDDIAQYYTMRSGQGSVLTEPQVTDGTTGGQAQAQTGSDQEE